MIPITSNDMELLVWGVVLGFIFFVGFYPFLSAYKATKVIVLNNNND